jgi:hypothetical protein
MTLSNPGLDPPATNRRRVNPDALADMVDGSHMKNSLLALFAIGILGCSVYPRFDQKLCPDANRVAISYRTEFEWSVAEASYIFVGTLVEMDDDWKTYSGIAASCANMEFAVDHVVAGNPPAQRLFLEHYMVGPGLWVEEQPHRGLRLSPRVLQPGQRYIVMADSRYRFCGEDSVDSIWLSTRSNLQATLGAMPIPVSEASQSPTLEHRGLLPYWRWWIARPEYTGTLGLTAVVTQSGYVARVQVTHHLVPDMDRDISSWVRWKWHFRPALRKGQPVAVETPLSVKVVDGVPLGMNEPGMSPNPPFQPPGH